MPDIQMCANTSCPARGDCHRYCARPSFRQAWGAYAPAEGRTRCDSFQPRWPTDRTRDEVDEVGKFQPEGT